MELSLQALDLVAPEKMDSLPDQVEESRPEFSPAPLISVDFRMIFCMNWYEYSPICRSVVLMKLMEVCQDGNDLVVDQHNRLIIPVMEIMDVYRDGLRGGVRGFARKPFPATGSLHFPGDPRGFRATCTHAPCHPLNRTPPVSL
ncbi:MAG: hypothetical protein MZU84_03075 [Sphingobacterium sp.]|nr:hypothetical protein [Sphingobacterium sp.]